MGTSSGESQTEARMKAEAESMMNVECPRCHAKPGEPCRAPGGRRTFRFHRERAQKAEATQSRFGDNFIGRIHPAGDSRTT